MKITVCIGSSCHIKGSREVVDIFKRMLDEHDLILGIELAATFCMGNCQNGVSVNLDGREFSVTPEIAESFFADHVLPKFESRQ